MPERMPPDDDPIIRSLRDAGIRPLHPPGGGPGTRIPRSVLLLIASVLVLLVFLPFVAGRLADWLWYREIGFELGPFIFVPRAFITCFFDRDGFECRGFETL